MSWLHDPVWLIVNALAVVRLERLIARDTFPPIQWLRDTLAEKLNRDRPTEHWIMDLVHCSWCLSIWVAGGVVALMSLLPTLWPWVAVPLAFSTVTGHLVSRFEE